MHRSLDQIGGDPVEITLSTGRVIKVHPLSLQDIKDIKTRIRRKWLEFCEGQASQVLNPAALRNIRTEIITKAITQDVFDNELAQEDMMPFVAVLAVGKSDKTFDEKTASALPLEDIKKIFETMGALMTDPTTAPATKDEGSEADFSRG